MDEISEVGRLILEARADDAFEVSEVYLESVLTFESEHFR
jgi:hypothetical protein